MPHTPEPFWNTLVGVYFQWYRENYCTTPVFKGSSPRDLRLIIAMLREHSKWPKWDVKAATYELKLFLSMAYNSDAYLRDHWSLAALYKSRNEIFFSYANPTAQ